MLSVLGLALGEEIGMNWEGGLEREGDWDEIGKGLKGEGIGRRLEQVAFAECSREEEAFLLNA